MAALVAWPECVEGDAVAWGELRNPAAKVAKVDARRPKCVVDDGVGVFRSLPNLWILLGRGCVFPLPNSIQSVVFPESASLLLLCVAVFHASPMQPALVTQQNPLETSSPSRVAS